MLAALQAETLLTWLLYARRYFLVALASKDTIFFAHSSL
jgi:hypothetical protein